MPLTLNVDELASSNKTILKAQISTKIIVNILISCRCSISTAKSSSVTVFTVPCEYFRSQNFTPIDFGFRCRKRTWHMKIKIKASTMQWEVETRSRIIKCLWREKKKLSHPHTLSMTAHSHPWMCRNPLTKINYNIKLEGGESESETASGK